MPTERAWFTTALATTPLVEKLRNIRLVICDVDGCLTDGRNTYNEPDTRSKSFNVLDGLGIQLTQQAGIHVAFVSGDRTVITTLRAQRLGIPEDLCHLVHWQDKPTVVQKIQAAYHLNPSQTLIVGDDIPDIALRPCGALLACPNDAPFYVQSAADLVLPRRGGHGAVRLLLDLLLYVQDKHPTQDLIANALR